MIQHLLHYISKHQEKYIIVVDESGAVRVTHEDGRKVMYAQKGWTLEQTKKFLDL